MLEIISRNKKFQFSNYFKYSSIFSGVFILIAIYLIFLGRGLNYGVDFRGGVEIQAGFLKAVDLGDLREVLKSSGVKGVTVQTIGDMSEHNYLIKIQAQQRDLNQVTEFISEILEKQFSKQGLDRRRVKTDIVGPKAGADLRRSGVQAMLWALLAIFIYIGLRFDIKYSPGAIAALIHDVLIVCGVFVLLAKEFNLQSVAALLAIIGYSVNDTVVVYDRVREHEAKYPGRSLKSHIDNATSETLSRTILTSGTTLLVSLMMFFYGGGGIRDFFFAISIGVVVGTYSSIFVAAPVTLFVDGIKHRKHVKA